MFNTKFKSSIDSSISQATFLNPPEQQPGQIYSSPNLDKRNIQKGVKSSVHLVKGKQKFNYVPKGTLLDLNLN